MIGAAALLGLVGYSNLPEFGADAADDDPAASLPPPGSSGPIYGPGGGYVPNPRALPRSSPPQDGRRPRQLVPQSGRNKPPTAPEMGGLY